MKDYAPSQGTPVQWYPSSPSVPQSGTLRTTAAPLHRHPPRQASFRKSASPQEDMLHSHYVTMCNMQSPRAVMCPVHSIF